MSKQATICVEPVSKSAQQRTYTQTCFRPEPASVKVSLDRRPQGIIGANYTALILTRTEAEKIHAQLGELLRRMPAPTKASPVKKSAAADGDVPSNVNANPVPRAKGAGYDELYLALSDALKSYARTTMDVQAGYAAEFNNANVNGDRTLKWTLCSMTPSAREDLERKLVKALRKVAYVRNVSVKEGVAHWGSTPTSLLIRVAIN